MANKIKITVYYCVGYAVESEADLVEDATKKLRSRLSGSNTSWGLYLTENAAKKSKLKYIPLELEVTFP